MAGNIWHAVDSISLHQILGGLNEDDTIILEVSEYSQDEGEPAFCLDKDKVTIQCAKDVVPLIKGKLEITASHCTLQNFKMQSPKGDKDTVGITLSGHNNTLENLELEGFNVALQLTGNSNQVSKISVDKSRKGLDIVGDNNQVMNNTLNGCGEGCSIKGNENILENITFTNVRRGLIVEGNYNKVISCTYILNELGGEGLQPQGVRLGRGVGNEVNALTCQGISEQNCYGLVIMPNAKSCIIKNSSVRRILMEQGERQLEELSFTME